MIQFESNMTQDMVDALKHFRTIYDAEIELCNGELERATAAANISLPAVAADGEGSVVHGARIAIDQIKVYWATRLAIAENEFLRLTIL